MEQNCACWMDHLHSAANCCLSCPETETTFSCRGEWSVGLNTSLSTVSAARYYKISRVKCGCIDD